MNALRGRLCEYGHIIPQGIGHVDGANVLLNEPDNGLPKLVCEECQDLIMQISVHTSWIDAKLKKTKKLAAKTDTTGRLQTLPGVGPFTALAIEVFAPDMKNFKRGRDLPLGLILFQSNTFGR